MPSTHNTAAFSEACAELYRPGLSLESYAQRTFEFLNRLVSAEFIAFGSLSLQTKQLDIGFDKPVANFAAAMDAFGQIMQNYRLFCWDPTVNEGRPFCRSDFFSQRQFRDLDVFAEVYRELGIDNHCAVHVPCAKDEIAFFGIERKGGPDFSPEERELLTLAQPHLGNAREVAKMWERMADEGARPEALVAAGLSVREADVLVWLAEGKSNEEIAILLRIQLSTVKSYLKTIFQKIGAPNRLAAALWTLRVSRRFGDGRSPAAEHFVSVPVRLND